jgi:hypothetical protein
MRGLLCPPSSSLDGSFLFSLQTAAERFGGSSWTPTSWTDGFSATLVRSFMAGSGKISRMVLSAPSTQAGSSRRSDGSLFERAIPAILIVVLGWESAVLYFQALGRVFWYDEMLTLNVSSLKPFSTLWAALRAGVDGMPVGYYLVVQLARRLPVDPHVALRLPSILGYILTLVGVYFFTRRRFSGVAALASVLFISLSPFRIYALEGRSYALLVGFLAIAACLWQRVGAWRLATPIFALFLTMAVACHHLAVVSISCFLLGELLWAFQSGRIRWGVCAACLVATVPFLINLPLLMHFKSVFGKHFWHPSSWSEMTATYGGYLGLTGFIATGLVAFLGIALGNSILEALRSPGGQLRDCFSPSEMMLIIGLLFYPAALAALTKIMGSGYVARYGWPVILGITLGLVHLFRPSRLSSIMLLTALAATFFLQSNFERKFVFKTARAGEEGVWNRLAEFSRDEPGIPIAVGGFDFLSAAEYAPAEIHDRLVDVADPGMSVRLHGSDSVDKANELLAQFVPIRTQDLATFNASHPRFVMYSRDGNSEWFIRYVLKEKYSLKMLSEDNGKFIFIVQR